MKLTVKYSSRFAKDLKLAQKQNKNLDKLFNVIEKLANLEKLEEKYRAGGEGMPVSPFSL